MRWARVAATVFAVGLLALTGLVSIGNPPSASEPVGHGGSHLRVFSGNPPSVPLVTAFTSSTVTLSWSQNVNFQVTNDTVLYGFTCGNWIQQVSTHGPVTTWTLTGMAAPKEYCFAVIAWDLLLSSSQSGNESYFLAGALPVDTQQLTIFNNATTATGTYQQLIVYNSAGHAKWINANWSNVAFYYPNLTTAFAWVESNATNASHTTHIWMNLYSIPAASRAVLTVAFYARTTQASAWTGPIGKAPKLTGSYGGEDDGSLTFPFYDNFTGSTINRAIVDVDVGAVPTNVSQSNGISLMGTFARIRLNYTVQTGETTMFGMNLTPQNVVFSGGRFFLISSDNGFFSNANALGTAGTTTPEFQTWGPSSSGSTSFSSTLLHFGVYSIYEALSANASWFLNDSYEQSITSNVPATVGDIAAWINAESPTTKMGPIFYIAVRSPFVPTAMPYYSLSPSPPSSPLISTYTASSVSLTWAQASDMGTVLNNTVLYGRTCGTWTGRVGLNGPATTDTLQFLPAPSEYCFAIQAWNATAHLTGGNTSFFLPGANPVAVFTLTVYNNASVATGTYQQRVNVNSSDYREFLSSNWSNVAFSYQANYTTAFAWIEDNATATSTNTTIWLRLFSIAAHSSVVLLVSFYRSAQASSWAGPTGKAPQLTTTYGHEDDGVESFPFYDNFTGSALSSRWTMSNVITFSVNNGFTATGTSNGFIQDTSFTFSPGTYVADELTNMTQNGSTNYWSASGIGVVPDDQGSHGCMLNTNFNSIGVGGWYRSSADLQSSSLVETDRKLQVLSAWFVNQTSCGFAGNYQTRTWVKTIVPGNPAPATEDPWLIGAGSGFQGGLYTFPHPVVDYWYRLRSDINNNTNPPYAIQPYAPIATPTGLTASSLSASSAVLTWTNPSQPPALSNATVLVGYSCGVWFERISTGQVTNTRFVTNLAPGTQFCFAVQVWGSIGNSTPSAPVVASTTTQPGPTPGPGPGPSPGPPCTPFPTCTVVPKNATQALTRTFFGIPIWEVTLGSFLIALLALVVFIRKRR